MYGYLIAVFVIKGKQQYMKYYHKPIIAITIIIFQLSCNNANNHEKLENLNEISTDSTQPNYASSSAAVETNKDSKRKFIRTAELKFKVKNVISSTYDIEDITNRHGGHQEIQL